MAYYTKISYFVVEVIYHMGKLEDEKISKLENKIKVLEDKKKQLQSQLRAKERKERTRELIQMGAILQSISRELFGLAPDIELFKKFVSDTDEGKDLLKRFGDYREKIMIAECEEISNAHK